METNRLSSKDRRRNAIVTVEVIGAEKACVIIISVMIISVMIISVMIISVIISVMIISVMIISVIELVSSKDERRYE